MSEKKTVFSSKIKYNGIFSFSDFYKFCYGWLNEEMGFGIVEKKYSEKISGDSKNVEVEWEGSLNVNDYFQFEVKISIKAEGLANVEVTQGNAKIKTNKGSIELGIKGNVIRDYRGKYEESPFLKFMRGAYEKWIITSTIDRMEEKLVGECDEFLAQAKAYLDLEGKK